MLAKKNRIRKETEYRTIFRHAKKFTSSHTIIYLSQDREQTVSRFGFIVSRSIGNAVARNRVHRQLKAACYSILGLIKPGSQLVIRALPSAREASYHELLNELKHVCEKGSVFL